MIGGKPSHWILTIQVLVVVIVGFSSEKIAPVKDCALNKTCAVELTTVTTTTTTTTTTKPPKTTQKTNVTGGGVVPYDVSGNDTNGSALKEIVIDSTAPSNSKDDTSHRFGNTSDVTSKSNSNAEAAKTGLLTNTTSANDTATTTTITTTTTTTTTEAIRVSPTNNGAADIVRFVPNKYCYCDFIVSIRFIFYRWKY